MGRRTLSARRTATRRTTCSRTRDGLLRRTNSRSACSGAVVVAASASSSAALSAAAVALRCAARPEGSRGDAGRSLLAAVQSEVDCPSLREEGRAATGDERLAPRAMLVRRVDWWPASAADCLAWAAAAAVRWLERLAGRGSTRPGKSRLAHRTIKGCDNPHAGSFQQSQQQRTQIPITTAHSSGRSVRQSSDHKTDECGAD